MTTWGQVWARHKRNIGFVEGPHNKNPWTEELGIGNVAYCSAAASVVPHNSGVQWPHWVQHPPKGEAYSPDWQKFPSWKYDHASQGRPCDLLPGDIVTYDWKDDGTADHTETVVDVHADLTFVTVGYTPAYPRAAITRSPGTGNSSSAGSAPRSSFTVAPHRQRRRTRRRCMTTATRLPRSPPTTSSP
jgi:hypothetical protein